MPTPSSHHLRPRHPAVITVWGLGLFLGAAALTGSIFRQRFLATAEADPAGWPKAHLKWCTGELLSLRVELEEAMLQELSANSQKEQLSRAEQVRRRSWNERLQEVSARCQHSDLAQNSALGLHELAGRYVKVVDELHELRITLASAVDHTLMHLKNDRP